MLRSVSTISGISKSVNRLKKNSDIGKINNQSTIKIKGLFIFEERYINGISDFNILTLTAFFISIFFNFFISEKP